MNLMLRNRRAATNGGEIGRLRDEVDRTFERLLAEPFGLTAPRLMNGAQWLPAIDLRDAGSEYIMRLEVPGVAADDVDVRVTGSTLSVAGHKRREEEESGEDYYISECEYGEFRRQVDLPEHADPDRITANFDRGVLTLHMPKKPGLKTRQIEIKPENRKVAVKS